jgi:hypothetical protein
MTEKPTCFVGMPCGRTAAERLAYRIWQSEVLKPAIVAEGYELWISESEAAPVPIAEQILEQLVEAPMAVFDLGGFEPGDVSNPNVMYELGIRHAFSKPAIVYSPSPQLPFDVIAGRAVIAVRSLTELANVQRDLRSSIAAARDGKFWRPTMAVATIRALRDIAGSRQGDDTAIIANQVAKLTEQVELLAGGMQQGSRSPAHLSGALAALLRRQSLIEQLANQAAISAVLSDDPPKSS